MTYAGPILKGEWKELGPNTWGFVRDDQEFHEMSGVDRQTYLDEIRGCVAGERGSWMFYHRSRELGRQGNYPAPLDLIVEVIPVGEVLIPGTDDRNNNREGKTAYRIIDSNRDIMCRYKLPGHDLINWLAGDGNLPFEPGVSYYNFFANLFFGDDVRKRLTLYSEPPFL